MPYTKEDLDKMTPTRGPKVPVSTIELNAEYKPIFQAWLDEHHVRSTCPACESPAYFLTSRVIPFANGELDGPWHIYIRLCRNCGHMLEFDLPVQITPLSAFTNRPADDSSAP